MKIKYFILFIIMFVFSISCQDTDVQQEKATANPNMHVVIVEEVIQANAYTYIRVSENGNEQWLAVTKREVEMGMTLYYEKGMVMNNFTSKDLNKTFDSILFLDKISKEPISSKMQTATPSMAKTEIQKIETSIEPAADGITVAEVFSNRETYRDKIVKIRGEVTKVNFSIMNRNWIHLQDGSSSGNNFDLVITTQDRAKEGDVVTFEGTIALDKDFGSGYKYEVIMENAKLHKSM